MEKVCTDFSAASRKYGYRMTELIFKRIEQIQYADDVEGLVSARIGRCHALKGDRAGQFAMDLIHPYRLIFERLGEVVQIARIVEILDFVKWTTISGM